jgi:hypothetical protein
MPADVLNFADELVALLAATFAAAGAEPTVGRAYTTETVLDEITGMLVHVVPVSYTREGPATRDEDYRDFQAAVVMMDRYTRQAAKVPVAWVDERVNLFEAAVVDPLSAHELLLGGVRFLQELDAVVVCDPDRLRLDSVFFSAVGVMFRQIRDV